MGLGDPTTCVYQLIVDENDIHDTKFIQYFIMNGLKLCIKLNNYVKNVFRKRSLSHNTAVPIDIKQNKYCIYLNTYTTVFT